MKFPKAIPGQTFPKHTKVSVSQVKRWLESGQPFDGFIVGNKVSSFHFFGGWFLAHSLKVSSLEDFDKHLNSFLFYLDPELGNGVSIFLKTVTPASFERKRDAVYSDDSH